MKSFKDLITASQINSPADTTAVVADYIPLYCTPIIHHVGRVSYPIPPQPNEVSRSMSHDLRTGEVVTTIVIRDDHHTGSCRDKNSKIEMCARQIKQVYVDGVLQQEDTLLDVRSTYIY